MTWTFRGSVVVGLLALAAAPVTAQVATRLVADTAIRFTTPLCPLRIQGRTSDGQRAFRTGIEDRDRAKRSTALQQAKDILTLHVMNEGARDAGAWYFLARTYLAMGDVWGADTAFARAEEYLPACEFDIQAHRQNAWATLANAGIDKMRQGDNDSALVLFKQAHAVFRARPDVSERIGVLLAYAGQNDSAIAYFRHAMEVSEGDSTLIENRNSAALNLASTLLRADRFAESVDAYLQYLEWNPGDMEARRALAYAFRQAGMTERADSLEAILADEFSRMNYDSLSTGDLMSVGVSFFNSQKYAEARDVFHRLMQRNRWNRDAVFNLANAHLALEEWAPLVQVAQHLLQIEPLNEDAYRLLGQAYRGLSQQQELIRTAESLVMLPVAVEVTGVRLGDAAAQFAATARGREVMDRSGLVQAPKPVTIVVEFLDQGGGVVGSQEVDIPALAVGQTHNLHAQVTGRGIIAWRYRLKA
jgi:tetratricopeptide (TPR) repeat protein